MGTGGAGKGVPRSPAGVDPKETPFITKHLAGKLRTRHKQVSGKETGGQRMGEGRVGCVCGRGGNVTTLGYTAISVSPFPKDL